MFNRCSYVIEEKTRVLDTVEALKNNQLKIMGENMYKTHSGLQNLYEVSCPELDYLVDFSKNFNEVIGSRMMGGGFHCVTLDVRRRGTLEGYFQGSPG